MRKIGLILPLFLLFFQNISYASEPIEEKVGKIIRQQILIATKEHNFLKALENSFFTKSASDSEISKAMEKDPALNEKFKQLKIVHAEIEAMVKKNEKEKVKVVKELKKIIKSEPRPGFSVEPYNPLRINFVVEHQLNEALYQKGYSFTTLHEKMLLYLELNYQSDIAKYMREEMPKAKTTKDLFKVFLTANDKLNMEKLNAKINEFKEANLQNAWVKETNSAFPERARESGFEKGKSIEKVTQNQVTPRRDKGKGVMKYPVNSERPASAKKLNTTKYKRMMDTTPTSSKAIIIRP